LREGAPALHIEGLVVEAGGQRILDDVSLHVERSEFLCLLGPNGGGKTTLLKAALGLLPVAAGTIELLGEPPEEGRRHVGYLPQRKAFARSFPATAADLIVAARNGRWPILARDGARQAAQDVLRRVGGEGLLDKSLASLSGGETQRVFLARALVNAPELLLLDEPTAGVDARGRGEFLDLLAEVAREGRLAAVLVTHNLAAVRRLADRVLTLDHRVLAAGRPDEVLADMSISHGSGHDHVDASAACEED
jgi:ABC-type Mn2+/Zn2+ transport system ATPase subunit